MDSPPESTGTSTDDQNRCRSQEPEETQGMDSYGLVKREEFAMDDMENEESLHHQQMAAIAAATVAMASITSANPSLSEDQKQQMTQLFANLARQAVANKQQQHLALTSPSTSSKELVNKTPVLKSDLITIL